MSASSVAGKVETWLSSAWHVKVPLRWLEACINWIQQENGCNLTQAQINKQVFEQWLLTDLRDLDYPVLPNCILDGPKGELNGFYSIQIDSLVDVSQPAYSQLQKIRGKNTVNEEVTANTQAPQKSWEAKPTRMLMLQLTDGIHQIQGMEYQPVPVLHSNLPPGTKITIQGNIAYRLGVLLLKSENVKLLGGEVEALLEEYAQERVLARLIGEAENPNPIKQHDHKQGILGAVDELGQTLGPSDEELLASLDENDEFTINHAIPLESGYCSRSNNSDTATHLLLSSNENYSQQGFGILLPNERSVPAVEYVDGDLDDLSLEDDLFLEEEIQEEIQTVQSPVVNKTIDIITQRFSHMPRSSLSYTSEKDGRVQLDSVSKEKSCGRELSVGDESSTSNFSLHHNVQHSQSFSNDFSLENVLEQKCNKIDVVKSSQKNCSFSGNSLLNKRPVKKTDSEISKQTYCVQTFSYRTTEKCKSLELDSPPFTYISVLLANTPETVTTVKVKAFIVTLTGNLTSSSGFWSIMAKISDSTAYLEVDIADEILTSLIGFSVPEMKQLRKDPILHQKLKDGLQKCQRELIDLCCLMTIEFNPFQSKATVLILQDVDAVDLENLKKRLDK
ncbi:recQ-mediated genome instability protein 1 [Terrapene carolina triunguis]|uniref:RecQ-mediated genome instability protein 1 n=1 Tax=Terrapene triunguis TaxID=2587831 RepID=A0A674JX04_9SAUR|nr:recQ-mediated genome instability protein 1 [Terrapene carolina triunguis]